MSGQPSPPPELARHALSVERRRLDRLAALSDELAELAEIGRVDGTAADAAELHGRTLAVAARVREIIEEARRGIIAIAAGNGANESDESVDVGGELGHAVIPRGAPASARAAGPGDPDAFWLAATLRHVPHAIVAGMLQRIDINVVSSIAMSRPDLLGTVLVSIPAVDAARWLALWHEPAVVRILSTVVSGVGAGWLDKLPGDLAVAALSTMADRESVRLLGELPSQSASGLLAGMDRAAAVRLLQLLPAEDAAEHLLQMDDLGLASPEPFIASMAGEIGDRCLRAMDRKRSERTEAVHLIRQIEVGPDRKQEIPKGRPNVS